MFSSVLLAKNIQTEAYLIPTSLNMGRRNIISIYARILYTLIGKLEALLNRICSVFAIGEFPIEGKNENFQPGSAVPSPDYLSEYSAIRFTI
jgi:hypothetical protein